MKKLLTRILWIYFNCSYILIASSFENICNQRFARLNTNYVWKIRLENDDHKDRNIPDASNIDELNRQLIQNREFVKAIVEGKSTPQPPSDIDSKFHASPQIFGKRKRNEDEELNIEVASDIPDDKSFTSIEKCNSQHSTANPDNLRCQPLNEIFSTIRHFIYKKDYKKGIEVCHEVLKVTAKPNFNLEYKYAYGASAYYWVAQASRGKGLSEENEIENFFVALDQLSELEKITPLNQYEMIMKVFIYTRFSELHYISDDTQAKYIPEQYLKCCDNKESRCDCHKWAVWNHMALDIAFKLDHYDLIAQAYFSLGCSSSNKTALEYYQLALKFSQNDKFSQNTQNIIKKRHLSRFL